MIYANLCELIASIHNRLEQRIDTKKVVITTELISGETGCIISFRKPEDKENELFFFFDKKTDIRSGMPKLVIRDLQGELYDLPVVFHNKKDSDYLATEKPRHVKLIDAMIVKINKQFGIDCGVKT